MSTFCTHMYISVFCVSMCVWYGQVAFQIPFALLCIQSVMWDVEGIAGESNEVNQA